MNSSKIRIIIVFSIVFLLTLSIIPLAFAKPRKTYIVDFIYDCEVKNEGFSNSPEDDDDISYEATAYGLEILNKFDLLEKKDIFGTVEEKVNSSDVPEELEDSLESLIAYGDANVYDLCHLLQALYTLEDSNKGYEVSSSIEYNVESYILSLLQSSGGYTPKASSTTETLASTYYALKIYELIDETPANETFTKLWIQSCQRYNGGYGGYSNLPATIENTYYAIMAMDIIDEADDLLAKDITVDYLKSFFEDNENDLDNYGGYYPNDDSDNTLISSTFYCVIGILMLDEDELEDGIETLSWILDRQNFRDGGFVDITDGADQKYSSLISSYLAFKVLKELDPQLESLNEEVFEPEFNWWLLIIIISGIGVAIVVIILIRRKRRI
ncbi:MAG: prenyltransferase/squalene oxidase repeat-containing protein [Candidatus Hermodarchaeota archaeon]